MVFCNSAFSVDNYGMFENVGRILGEWEVSLHFDSKGAITQGSRHWSIFSRAKQDFFYRVKKRIGNIADRVSNSFRGVRSCFDLVESVGFQLSKITARFLYLTKLVDLFDVPYTITLVVRDFFYLFALGTLSEKVEAFFNFITDLDIFVSRGAKFFDILNKFELVSGIAIKWCDVFYVISFFVNFINIRRDSISCKRAFVKVVSLEKKRKSLQDANSLENKQKIALHILKRLREKSSDIKERTRISKRALGEKISKIKKDILDDSTSVAVIDQVDELLRLLVVRTKKIGIISGVSIVNSIVDAAGCALGLFTPFAAVSLAVISIAGIVSFVMWGGKLFFIKKNPFLVNNI